MAFCPKCGREIDQLIGKCVFTGDALDVSNLVCPVCRRKLANDLREADILFSFPSLIRKVGWSRKTVKLLYELPDRFIESLDRGDVKDIIDWLNKLKLKDMQSLMKLLKKALTSEDYCKVLARMLLEV